MPVPLRARRLAEEAVYREPVRIAFPDYRSSSLTEASLRLSSTGADIPQSMKRLESKALQQLNLMVWAKTNAGMGSLYRSQHELLPFFKKGTAPHINNIELGKNGRWRSNVWNYPGASSLGSDSRKGLEFHPTVKPVSMLEDSILDVTKRGEIALDPFLGSGSTLIAAERQNRVCYGIELDPRYVDVAIRRFESTFSVPAVLEDNITVICRDDG